MARVTGVFIGLLCWALVVPDAAGGPSRLERARRLQQEGKLEEAIALLENLAGHEPENLEGGELLAWLYGKTSRPAKAVEVYRRLLAFYSSNADLHNNLGALLLQQRRFDEAQAQFESARSLDPRSARPHYNLGLLHFRRGAFSVAADAFHRAVEIEPGRSDYHFALARAYRGAYDFEKAAAAFQKGLELQPPPSTAHAARIELALTLKHQGLFHASEKELQGLLRGHSDDPEALFQLGRLYLAMNRYGTAEAVFRRLAEANPRHIPTLFMLGLVTYRRHEPEEALRAFRALLELDPHHAEASYYVGLILRQSGELAPARAAFEDALRVDPEHLGANYNLGLLLAKLGEKQASRERLDRFRRLNESHERLDYLEERVRTSPTNARNYFELGKEYARQNRTREALHAFQRALEIDPNLSAAEVAISDLLGKRR